MINLPDKIQASTQGFAIANAKELGGHRQVATLTELYALPDAWLSESTTNANNDAIGQQWWVQSEEAEYRLTDWDNRSSADGWEIQTVEIPDANIKAVGDFGSIEDVSPATTEEYVNNKIVPNIVDYADSIFTDGINYTKNGGTGATGCHKGATVLVSKRKQSRLLLPIKRYTLEQGDSITLSSDDIPSEAFAFNCLMYVNEAEITKISNKTDIFDSENSVSFCADFEEDFRFTDPNMNERRVYLFADFQNKINSDFAILRCDGYGNWEQIAAVEKGAKIRTRKGNGIVTCFQEQRYKNQIVDLQVERFCPYKFTPINNSGDKLKRSVYSLTDGGLLSHEMISFFDKMLEEYNIKIYYRKRQNYGLKKNYYKTSWWTLNRSLDTSAFRYRGVWSRTFGYCGVFRGDTWNSVHVPVRLYDKSDKRYQGEYGEGEIVLSEGTLTLLQSKKK